MRPSPNLAFEPVPPGRTSVTAAHADADIFLRGADLFDCERVYEWSFDSSVHAQSHRPEVVTLQAHTAWFARRLRPEAGPMWIVEEDRLAVGVVRIDPVDGGGRISITLAARAHGRGIGKRAIRLACEAWGRVVYAEVLATNAAGRACFEACGFTPVAARDGLVTYRG